MSKFTLEVCADSVESVLAGRCYEQTDSELMKCGD